MKNFRNPFIKSTIISVISAQCFQIPFVDLKANRYQQYVNLMNPIRKPITSRHQQNENFRNSAMKSTSIPNHLWEMFWNPIYRFKNQLPSAKRNISDTPFVKLKISATNSMKIWIPSIKITAICHQQHENFRIPSIKSTAICHQQHENFRIPSIKPTAICHQQHENFRILFIKLTAICHQHYKN